MAQTLSLKSGSACCAPNPQSHGIQPLAHHGWPLPALGMSPPGTLCPPAPTGASSKSPTSASSVPGQAGGGPSTAIKALEKGFIPAWLLGWLEEPFLRRAVSPEQPEPPGLALLCLPGFPRGAWVVYSFGEM